MEVGVEVVCSFVRRGAMVVMYVEGLGSFVIEKKAKYSFVRRGAWLYVCAM